MTPRVAEIIAAKRDGKELEPGAIAALIAGYTSGDVPDYQMAAFAMAVYFRGMTVRERAAALIAVADPRFREDLERAARDLLGG